MKLISYYFPLNYLKTFEISMDQSEFVFIRTNRKLDTESGARGGEKYPYIFLASSSAAQRRWPISAANNSNSCKPNGDNSTSKGSGALICGH